MNSAEPTWVTAEQPPVPEPSPPNGERVSNPTATIKEEDGEFYVSLLLVGEFLVLLVIVSDCLLITYEGYRLLLCRKQLALD